MENRFRQFHSFEQTPPDKGVDGPPQLVDLRWLQGLSALWRLWGRPLGGFMIALSSCSAIATPEAVEQVAQTFTSHRTEFEDLATTAVTALQDSGASSQRLPDTTFYDSAWAAISLNGQAIVVDFVVDEFYLPLVYVSTDNPQDAHDTCANGGRVVQDLEPYWYVCQRDWN